MRKLFAQAALAAVLITAPVAAQHYDNDRNWNGDRDSDWDPARHYAHSNRESREMVAEDRVYRGSDGRYYCKRSDGTTGLVLGAIGGGLIGHALGGGVLGTLVGAGGGGLLGKHLDQRNDTAQNRRNGYRCE
jgi:uncharacterized protein YcfJ